VYVMKDPANKMMSEPLPKTHFIKMVEDSSKSFFRPIKWENLASYEEDTTKNEEDTSDVMESKKDTLSDTLITKSGDNSDELDYDAPDSLGKELIVLADTSSDTDGEAKGESEKSKKQLKKVALDSIVYLDEAGLFKKRDYRPKFSLDVAAAALGVSNFGSYGQGFISLTDLMGDHEIQIGLTLNGDIRDNSQYALQYHFLPYKIDYIVGGFYQSFSNQYYSENGFLESKVTSYGGNALIIYPLSIFTRWQLGINTQYIIRKDEENIVTEKGVFAYSALWSHDNVQWGIVGPANGRRINAELLVAPPVFDKDLFFTVGNLDFRNYWNFYKKFTLAWRVDAGFSEAMSNSRNPHHFLLGGDDFYTIYPIRSELDNLPDNSDIEGYYFLDISKPLRGYPFFEFKGNRKILTNLEFRFPFIREFSLAWPIPLAIRYVTGVIFFDYGAAWTYTQSHIFNTKEGKLLRSQRKSEKNLEVTNRIKSENGIGSDENLTPELTEAKNDEVENWIKSWEKEHQEVLSDNQGMGIGYGLRVNLGIFVLRWTKAWPIDGIGSHKKSQTTYWSLGAEF